jgi:hypothetical protein
MNQDQRDQRMMSAVAFGHLWDEKIRGAHEALGGHISRTAQHFGMTTWEIRFIVQYQDIKMQAGYHK